ncbi:MAG: methyltransferase domain-containing protein [Rhodanobacteraceae bacterium]
MLDEVAREGPELSQNLSDIRRLNRWTGGTYLAVQHIFRVLKGRGGQVLDVGTGSADLLVALNRRATKLGMSLELVGLDRSPAILVEAGRLVAGLPIELVQADALHLPFPDASFDVVSCCLALHHFPGTEAGAALAEMWRVARRGVVVLDLERGRVAYLALSLLTHLASRNRLTRHDGPRSVLNGFTEIELLAAGLNAGMTDVTVTPARPFRLVLVAKRPVVG